MRGPRLTSHAARTSGQWTQLGLHPSQVGGWWLPIEGSKSTKKSPLLEETCRSRQSREKRILKSGEANAGCGSGRPLSSLFLQSAVEQAAKFRRKTLTV